MEAGEMLVAVVLGMAILRPTEHQIAERIRPIVRQEQKEWPLLVLFDELDPFARPQVGRVAGFFAHLAVLNDFLIVKLAG
jgi:hypothetical protein